MDNVVFIESSKDFDELKSYREGDAIVTIIGVDHELHNIINTPCMAVISILNNHYIIPFEHNEGITSVTYSDFVSFLNNLKKLYVLDKKKFYHLTKIETCLDINLIHHFVNGESINEEQYQTKCHQYFNHNFHELKNHNKFIPIYSHIEKIIKLHEYCKKIICNFSFHNSYFKLNDLIIELCKIEENGLYVDVDKLIKKFSTRKKFIKSNLIYSEYNLYTSTGRPSNKHGGINFSALNKKNGERECFKSRFKNGKLIYFDFNAFHPHLVASLIGYDFKNQDVYQYLNKFLKEKDIARVKVKVFEQLYGGITKKYEDVPFFQKTKNFIINLWDEFENRGFIQTPVFERRIKDKFIEQPHPNKIFNYMLQAYETEIGLQVLREIRNVLINKSSKIILYLYDGILIDFNTSDGKELIGSIKNIMEMNGKFPISIEYGDTFHNLKKIN